MSLYISENLQLMGIFRVDGLKMLICLFYTKMHAVFSSVRAIYNFVLHMLNFIVDSSIIPPNI